MEYNLPNLIPKPKNFKLQLKWNSQCQRRQSIEVRPEFDDDKKEREKQNFKPNRIFLVDRISAMDSCEQNNLNKMK